MTMRERVRLVTDPAYTPPTISDRLRKLYERREAICASILSAPDLRKRDLLQEVQNEINRLETTR